MASIAVTRESFEQQVGKQGILVLDWWAPWCAPCRAFGPTFERVSARNPDIVFGKVNTEEQPELAGGMQITAIPTLMIFRDGILLVEQAGALPERALDELLGQVKALDMDLLRKELEARKQGKVA